MNRFLPSTLVLATLMTLAPIFAAAERGPPSHNDIDWTTGSVTSLPDEGAVIAGPEDAPCTAAAEGAQRYSRRYKTILVCDGRHWNALQTIPVTVGKP